VKKLFILSIHSVSMCSVWFPQQTALTGWALQRIRVSCDVRTELLDIIYISSMPWFSSLSKRSGGSHKFPVATARFSCSPPYLNSSNCLPKLCNSPLIHKIKIPRPLALTTHHTALTRTSGRSLGTFRQNNALSPPQNNVPPTHPITFPFRPLFCYSLSMQASEGH
jgi:hypothetical protein